MAEKDRTNGVATAASPSQRRNNPTKSANKFVKKSQAAGRHYPIQKDAEACVRCRHHRSSISCYCLSLCVSSLHELCHTLSVAHGAKTSPATPPACETSAKRGFPLMPAPSAQPPHLCLRVRRRQLLYVEISVL